MQTLHFSFGIGAFIAPFIAEPFLSKNDTTHDSNYTDAAFTLPLTSTGAANNKVLPTKKHSQNRRAVQEAYQVGSPVFFNLMNFQHDRTKRDANISDALNDTSTLTNPIAKKPSAVNGA